LASSHNAVQSSELEIIKTCSTTQGVPQQSLNQLTQSENFSQGLVQQLRQSYQICVSEELGECGAEPVAFEDIQFARSEEVPLSEPILSNSVADSHNH